MSRTDAPIRFINEERVLLEYCAKYYKDGAVHLLSGTFPAPSARLGVPSSLGAARPPRPNVVPAATGRIAAVPPLPATGAPPTVAPLRPSGNSGRFCWQVLNTDRHEAKVAVQLYRSTMQSRYPGKIRKLAAD